jgi:hypothetical protein
VVYVLLRRSTPVSVTTPCVSLKSTLFKDGVADGYSITDGTSVIMRASVARSENESYTVR